MRKYLGYWTLFTALCISAVAAYYSIIGLTAIFAAAVIPVIIMGTVLEVGKVTTAVWLHTFWTETSGLMKTYLTTATLVLMLITSMGIFGFLSKAHIEQTAVATQGQAQITRLVESEARQLEIIDRAEDRILQIQNQTGDFNASIQQQIENEEKIIASARESAQSQIDTQQQIIDQAMAASDSRAEPYQREIARIEARINQITTRIENARNIIRNLSEDTETQLLVDRRESIQEDIDRANTLIGSSAITDIQTLQTIIGVVADGVVGNNTRSAFDDYIEGKEEEISSLTEEIQTKRISIEEEIRNIRSEIEKDELTVTELSDARSTEIEKLESLISSDNPVVVSARGEIARIQSRLSKQIEDSSALINELRSQVTVTRSDAMDAEIEQQREIISMANEEIDRINDEVFVLETEARTFEAEVGPVKYIADMIYKNNSTSDNLEKAVRWVILLLVFVFDPLAIVLVLAGVSTIISTHPTRHDDKDEPSAPTVGDSDSTDGAPHDDIPSGHRTDTPEEEGSPITKTPAKEDRLNNSQWFNNIDLHEPDKKDHK